MKLAGFRLTDAILVGRARVGHGVGKLIGQGLEEPMAQKKMAASESLLIAQFSSAKLGCCSWSHLCGDDDRAASVL